MAVKPILFSGPMVRAMLEGRKTMTRRVLKPQPPPECTIHYMLGNEPWKSEENRTRLRHHWEAWGGDLYENRPKGHMAGSFTVYMPHTPGDLLYVRENFRGAKGYDDVPPSEFGNKPIWYNADGDPDMSVWWHLSDRTRPGIHMPRWISRLTLEVTEVRVERVQDISEADAKWEGLSCVTKDGRINKYGIPDSDGLPGTDNYGWEWQDWSIEARQAFRTLWDSLNEKRGYGWDANLWVSVTSFKVHHQNVDALLAEREAA